MKRMKVKKAILKITHKKEKIGNIIQSKSRKIVIITSPNTKSKATFLLLHYLITVEVSLGLKTRRII
jgi:hypothetical protein